MVDRRRDRARGVVGAVRRRCHRHDAEAAGRGPETMDGGSEPPAVANFLSNRWEVTTSAIPATLVDLAARGHVGIEAIGDGENLIRLRSRARTSRTTRTAGARARARSRATGPFLARPVRRLRGAGRALVEDVPWRGDRSGPGARPDPSPLQPGGDGTARGRVARTLRGRRYRPRVLRACGARRREGPRRRHGLDDRGVRLARGRGVRWSTLPGLARHARGFGGSGPLARRRELPPCGTIPSATRRP